MVREKGEWTQLTYDLSGIRVLSYLKHRSFLDNAWNRILPYTPLPLMEAPSAFAPLRLGSGTPLSNTPPATTPLRIDCWSRSGRTKITITRISSRLPLLTYTSLDRPFPGFGVVPTRRVEAASMRREMLPWKSSGRMDVTVVVEARNGRILVWLSTCLWLASLWPWPMLYRPA